MRWKSSGDLIERVLWLRFNALAVAAGERYQSSTQSKDGLFFNGRSHALLLDFAYASPLNENDKDTIKKTPRGASGWAVNDFMVHLRSQAQWILHCQSQGGTWAGLR